MRCTALTSQLLLDGHGSEIVRAIKFPYEMESFRAHVRNSNTNARSPFLYFGSFASEHVFCSFYKAAQYHQSLTHCARTCLIVSFIRFIRTVTLQKNNKNHLCFSQFCNCHFLTFNSNVVKGIFSEWRATSDFPGK